MKNGKLDVRAAVALLAPQGEIRRSPPAPGRSRARAGARPARGDGRHRDAILRVLEDIDARPPASRLGPLTSRLDQRRPASAPRSPRRSIDRGRDPARGREAGRPPRSAGPPPRAVGGRQDRGEGGEAAARARAQRRLDLGARRRHARVRSLRGPARGEGQRPCQALWSTDCRPRTGRSGSRLRARGRFGNYADREALARAAGRRRQGIRARGAVVSLGRLSARGAAPAIYQAPTARREGAEVRQAAVEALAAAEQSGDERARERAGSGSPEGSHSGGERRGEARPRIRKKVGLSTFDDI